LYTADDATLYFLQISANVAVLDRTSMHNPGIFFFCPVCALAYHTITSEFRGRLKTPPPLTLPLYKSFSMLKLSE